jgi:ABC-2 type transport system ATP-binding protein
VIEIRQLIRALGQTHTVIFSSHILAEVQAIADRVLILHKGQLVLDAPLTELEKHLGQQELIVETEKPLQWDFLPPAVQLSPLGPLAWAVQGPADIDLRRLISQAATQQQVPLLRLEKRQLPLEEVFQRLTRPTETDPSAAPVL